MTILIKGMKMPKKGYKDIRIHADGSWTAYAETVPYNDIYGAAVEVPTPHGRLIDADALKVERPIMDGSITVGVSYAITRKEIDEAPTIMEAEAER